MKSYRAHCNTAVRYCLVIQGTSTDYTSSLPKHGRASYFAASRSLYKLCERINKCEDGDWSDHKSWLLKSRSSIRVEREFSGMKSARNRVKETGSAFRNGAHRHGIHARYAKGALLRPW